MFAPWMRPPPSDLMGGASCRGRRIRPIARLARRATRLMAGMSSLGLLNKLARGMLFMSACDIVRRGRDDCELDADDELEDELEVEDEREDEELALSSWPLPSMNGFSSSSRPTPRSLSAGSVGSQLL